MYIAVSLQISNGGVSCSVLVNHFVARYSLTYDLKKEKEIEQRRKLLVSQSKDKKYIYKRTLI